MNNLREIAKALAVSDDRRVENKVYDRLRMLRDRGLVPASERTIAGKTTLLDEADTAFAVLVFHASEAGVGHNTLGFLKDEIYGDGHPEKQPIRQHLPDLKSGQPVFVRLDVCRLPWPFVDVMIGKAELLARPVRSGTVQSTFWPLTDLFYPIQAALRAA